MSHDHPGLSRQSVAISRPINPAPRSISRTTASSAASQSGPTTANQDPADALADGINGSAMAVPPPKASTMGLRPENVKSNNSPRKSVAASKSDSTAADVKLSKEVSDRNRELKDALMHERQQVAKLQQIIESLRIELADCQLCNNKLQAELKHKESEFKELLERERQARMKAEETVEHKTELLRLKEAEHEDTLNHYRQQVADLSSLLKKREAEIDDLKAEKEHEVSTRDAKLNRLKQQMADALQGNSWQRQQQLEELNKELVKVQEEADVLRSTLRNANKNGCSNCEKMSGRLSKLEIAAKAGDKTISDLKELVAAYEKQLASTDASQRSASNIGKSGGKHHVKSTK